MSSDLPEDFEVWFRDWKAANPNYIDGQSQEGAALRAYAVEKGLSDDQVMAIISSRENFAGKQASQGFVLGYITPPAIPINPSDSFSLRNSAGQPYDLSYADRSMLSANTKDNVYNEWRDQTSFRSSMIPGYIDSLSETDYENLAQGLFVDGYMAGVINDSSEYLERINVIAAAGNAANELATVARELGVEVQDLLPDGVKDLSLAPTLDGRYANTDFESDEFQQSFFAKMNELKDSAIVLPDAQSVQLAYDEASQKILGYDLRKTSPQVYQAFLAGMRSTARNNSENDFQYDTSARIQTNIMQADPVGAEFLETSGRRDNFMDAIFGAVS